MDKVYVSVSADGVMALPAALLPHFAGSAVVCCGKDSSLLLCTQPQWDDFLARLRESSAKSQAASRVFVTTAVQVDLSDGCLTLPPHLRAHAAITSAARIEFDGQSCHLCRWACTEP